MLFSFKNLLPSERALLIASFFQSMGMEIAYFVGITGYAAYDLQADETLIAKVMLSLTLSMMAGSLVAGPLVDRFGPRRVLITLLLITGTVSFGAFYVGKNIPLFILFVVLVGFHFSASKTVFHSYAPFLYSTKVGLSRVNSFILGGGYVAAIVGPVIGALIVKSYPTMTTFGLSAFGMYISAAAVYFAQELRTPFEEDEGKPGLKQSLDGAKLLFKVSSLRYYLGVGILLWFSFGAFDALESLYYKNIVKVSIEYMGWVNSMIGIGLIVGVFILSRISFKRLNAKLLAWLVAGVGVGSIVYTATTSIYFVMLGGFLLGVAFGIADPLMRTLMQHDAPLGSIGRVMGASNLIRSGMTVFPLLAAPGLARLFGIQRVLVGASTLTVILAMGLYVVARRVDATQGPGRDIKEIDH